jgi:hypothetical protein
MENIWIIAIIVVIIIFVISCGKTEGFGLWRKDTFVAQYGITRG